MPGGKHLHLVWKDVKWVQGTMPKETWRIGASRTLPKMSRRSSKIMFLQYYPLHYERPQAKPISWQAFLFGVSVFLCYSIGRPSGFNIPSLWRGSGTNEMVRHCGAEKMETLPARSEDNSVCVDSLRDLAVEGIEEAVHLPTVDMIFAPSLLRQGWIRPVYRWRPKLMTSFSYMWKNWTRSSQELSF